MTRKEAPRGAMVERTCVCGNKFTARVADVKRGWGKFCSKSCKAIKQERKTGQCAAYRERQRGEFSNAHLFSNEE